MNRIIFMRCMAPSPIKPVLPIMFYSPENWWKKEFALCSLFDWGWDSHGSDANLAIDIGFINKCRQVDKSMTALILDLKQRGLLEETLVVWGGEFGQNTHAGKPRRQTKSF